MRSKQDFDRELRQFTAAYGGLSRSYNIRRDKIPNQEGDAIYSLLNSVRGDIESLERPLRGHPDVTIGRSIIESRDRRLAQARSALDRAREAMSKYLYGPQDFEDAKGLAALSREELAKMKDQMDPEDFSRASRVLDFADATRSPTEGNDYTFETDVVLEQVSMADRIMQRYKPSGEPKTEDRITRRV